MSEACILLIWMHGVGKGRERRHKEGLKRSVKMGNRMERIVGNHQKIVFFHKTARETRSKGDTRMFDRERRFFTPVRETCAGRKRF